MDRWLAMRWRTRRGRRHPPASYRGRKALTVSVRPTSALFGESTVGPAKCLIRRVQACRLCPQMAHARRVLSEANGPWHAAVMLVGEAPGRLGAQRSGIPFVGDQAGRRLDELLRAVGWSREGLFLTNAVLCNPRDSQGNNRAPRSAELANCRQFLAETISLVNPVVVIALGAVALRTLGQLEPHDLSLARDAGTLIRWNKRWLGVLYHPAAQSAIRRPWPRQVRDACRLGQRVDEILDTAGGKNNPGAADWPRADRAATSCRPASPALPGARRPVARSGRAPAPDRS
jgi:uracil-DNA glycosylase family 4